MTATDFEDQLVSLKAFHRILEEEFWKNLSAMNMNLLITSTLATGAKKEHPMVYMRDTKEVIRKRIKLSQPKQVFVGPYLNNLDSFKRNEKTCMPKINVFDRLCAKSYATSLKKK